MAVCGQAVNRLYCNFRENSLSSSVLNVFCTALQQHDEVALSVHKRVILISEWEARGNLQTSEKAAYVCECNAPGTVKRARRFDTLYRA